MRRLLALLAVLLLGAQTQAATTFTIPATFDSFQSSAGIAEAEDTTSGGAITVTSTCCTNVIDTAPTVTVAVGDWVHMTGHTHISKGGTQGLTLCRFFQQGGTAVGDWLASSSSHYGIQWVNLAASSTAVIYLDYWLRITTAGTFQPSIECDSDGSDGTVSNGGATINSRVFR